MRKKLINHLYIRDPKFNLLKLLLKLLHTTQLTNLKLAVHSNNKQKKITSLYFYRCIQQDLNFKKFIRKDEFMSGIMSVFYISQPPVKIP